MNLSFWFQAKPDIFEMCPTCAKSISGGPFLRISSVEGLSIWERSQIMTLLSLLEDFISLACMELNGIYEASFKWMLLRKELALDVSSIPNLD